MAKVKGFNNQISMIIQKSGTTNLISIRYPRPFYISPPFHLPQIISFRTENDLQVDAVQYHFEV